MCCVLATITSSSSSASIQLQLGSCILNSSLSVRQQKVLLRHSPFATHRSPFASRFHLSQETSLLAAHLLRALSPIPADIRLASHFASFPTLAATDALKVESRKSLQWSIITRLSFFSSSLEDSERVHDCTQHNKTHPNLVLT